MAAETAIIPTVTTFYKQGSSIFIKSEYLVDELPDTITARIADSIGSQDGVSYVEGELIIQMKNHPEHIDYELQNGELILIINTGDEDNYLINSNGDLIYQT